MRNVFDQYEQPENKVTHALISTLGNARQLVRPFLAWLGLRPVPPVGSLRFVEQQVPGILASGEEKGSQGLPDACVFNDDGWIVLFESKVQAQLHIPQLARHLKTAAGRGYERPLLVVITVEPCRRSLPEGTIAVQWRDIYRWFSSRISISPWARTFVDYMEVFESRVVSTKYLRRGAITMFTGLRFDADNPYTYREGKRLIRLLGDELQQRKDLHRIGVDPKGKRRVAITGRGLSPVWDFLPLRVAKAAKQFTAFPHLTMVIGPVDAVAAITIPNGVQGGFRTRLKQVGIQGFRNLVATLEVNLRPVLDRSLSARPYLYASQRHYKTQRSPAERDAHLEADLRTIAGRGKSVVKYQPEWVDAVYSVLVNKRSNIQLGVAVHFPYDCPIVRSPRVVGLFADTWEALSPLIDFVLERD